LSHINAAAAVALHSVAKSSAECEVLGAADSGKATVPINGWRFDRCDRRRRSRRVRLLKFSLELEGFGVRAYGSAPELLNAGDLAACDCFVIDQRMPAMNGMELIAKLRDLKIQTPAILLISHPNPALSARAAIAGVPVVEKPLLSDTLVDKIREACARN
jgi:two-component system, LuxR family, response regulator FixJ